MSFDATLTRDHVLKDCILGTLIAKGQVFYTLELPWLENAHNISCIPTGAYKCVLIDRVKEETHSKVYHVLDVPDRDGILILPGNFPRDSHGRILIGLGRDLELRKIINSKQGLDNFVSLMGKEFSLSIS